MIRPLLRDYIQIMSKEGKLLGYLDWRRLKGVEPSKGPTFMIPLMKDVTEIYLFQGPDPKETVSYSFIEFQWHYDQIFMSNGEFRDPTQTHECWYIIPTREITDEQWKSEGFVRVEWRQRF